MWVGVGLVAWGNRNATISDIGKQMQKQHSVASNVVWREAREEGGLLSAENVDLHSGTVHVTVRC